MFFIRLRSSMILLAISITVIVLGGNYLFAAFLFISMIGLFELYRIIGVEKKVPGIIGYTAALVYSIMILDQSTDYLMMLFILLLLLLMIVYVLCFPQYTIEQIAVSFFGLFYVNIMLSYIYQVRMLPGGAFIVWLIFIGAWGSDTCAYCIGILFGKHKLAPKLSPKKSIEGSIGGIVGAALIGFFYALIIKDKISGIDQPELIFALVGAASSIISQTGDLAASAIKRNHMIKDYGSLIPGHGGILDRFDSIIFTAPVVYYCLILFGGIIISGG